MVICQSRSPHSAAFACAILYFLTAPAAAATEAEIGSAALSELLQGNLVLQSPGGALSFGPFALAEPPAGTAVPDLSKIFLTANSTSLFWQLDEDRHVLRSGDTYQLEIAFLANVHSSQHALSSATIDIAGATIGTKEDAHAELTMQLFDNGGAPLGLIKVVEAPIGRDLIDTLDLAGPNRWMAKLQIRADGGSGSAALVLTDFETSFTTVAIPEPINLVSGPFLAVVLLLGRRTHRLRPLVMGR